MKLPVDTESGNGNGLGDGDDYERKVAVRTCKTSKSEILPQFHEPLSG